MLLIHRSIEFLLYPPGNLLLFLLIALIFNHFKKFSKTVLMIGILQLLLFSLPVVSSRLIHSLEDQYPPHAELWKKHKPDAIVVLGGGRNDQAYEYGGISPSSAELERLRYAAFLYQQTQLPVLVTGGDPLGDGTSEASLMKQTLQQAFNVPVKWLEDKSHTTWENAQFSDAMLKKEGIKSAWIVTHAWHMPRSLYAFSGRSVNYLPASHSYGIKPYNKKWMKWIPQSTALFESTIALHEYLGLLWYKFKA